MPDGTSVSLGTVYTGATLDLKQFNAGYAEMIAKIAKLGQQWNSLKFDTQGIRSGLSEATQRTDQATRQITATLQNAGVAQQRSLLQTAKLTSKLRLVEVQESQAAAREIQRTQAAAARANVLAQGAAVREVLRTKVTAFKLETQAAREAARQEAEAFRAAARQRIADTRETQARTRNAEWFPQKRQGAARREMLDTASGAAMMGGGAVLLGLGDAAMQAAHFSSKMVEVANNANLTDQQLAKMKATVIALGKESGASFEDLAEGFRRFINLGFTADEATKMLVASMKSAVATGASVDATSDALAKAMKEFAIPTAQAAQAMNVLHLAAAEGNGTLQEFTDAVGPAFSMSANLGVSLVDVSAALVALTRHGYSFAEAATQMHGELAHIVNPSQAAEKELHRLSKTSGVDLVADFTLAGLKAKGLGGIMDDLKRATGDNEAEILKLIPAFRGGTGAMVEAGNGAEDYKKVLSDLNQAMAGTLDPTTKGYARTQGQLDQQVKKTNNELLALYVKHGPQVIQFLTNATREVGDLADKFDKLPKPIQDATINTLAWGAALTAALGGAGKLLGIVTKLKNLAGGAGLFGLGAGGAGAAGLLGRVGLMSGTGGLITGAGARTAFMGTSGLGGNLLGGAVLAAPAIFGGYMASKIMGAQNDGYNAEQRGNGAADLSPYVDRVAALRKQEKASPNDPNIKGELAKAVAALHQMSGANDRARAATGGNALTAAMATHIGQATGVQCGQAVTNALKANGISASVTNLAKAAAANPKLQMRPDAAGHFPPGTIVFFPGKQGGKGIGHDPTEHFGMMGGILATGKQPVLESTTAGGNGRHYRGDRGFAEIAAGHGGQYLAFAPPGKIRAGNAPPPADPQTVLSQQKANQDIEGQLFEATHGEYENKRYEAKQEYKTSLADDDVTDKLAVKKLYQAKLKEINQEEAEEQKKHHESLEKDAAAHAKRMAALQYPPALKAFHKTALKAGETVDQIKNSIAAMTGDPETLALNKQEAGAKGVYAARMKTLGYDPSQPLIYTPAQQKNFDLAKQERDLKLAGIQNARQAKKTSDDDRDNGEVRGFIKQAQDDTTGTNREIWQHAGGDMKAYFQSLREEADGALADAKAKYGPLDAAGKPNAKANAPAVAAADAAHTAKLGEITQQETDAAQQKAGDAKKIADNQARYEMATGKLSLAQYRDYLAKRKEDYEAYSDDWIQITDAIAEMDKKVWLKEADDLKGQFDKKLISRQKYEAGLGQILGQIKDVPQNDETRKNIEDKKTRTEEKDKIDVSGTLESGMTSAAQRSIESWKGFHGFMKSMTTDVKGMLKSLLSEIAAKSIIGGLFGNAPGLSFGAKGSTGGGGLNVLGALGGLFGRGKKSPLATPLALPAAALGSAIPTVQFGSGRAPYGMGANLLGDVPQLTLLNKLGGLGALHGINGPVGGAAGGLDIMSLAGLFPGGGILSKLLGGGGGIFGGLKKLFHFAKGTWSVPGTGNHDSVPSMLTPGEMVLPKAGAQLVREAFAGRGDHSPAMARRDGDTHIHVTHNGDINNHEDGKRFHENVAMQIKQQLPVTTPGT